jgi:hypothetical protein
MSDDSSNQPLWERLERLPSYVQSALAGVFIPLAAVLFGSLLAAIFPVALFPMPFLAVPLVMFGFGFSIYSIVSGYRRRMSGVFALGLVGLVLNGAIASYDFGILSFFFGGLGGC